MAYLARLRASHLLHPGRWSEVSRYWFGLSVGALIFGTQIAGGIHSGSLALFADSAHVFTDVLAYSISIYVFYRARSHADEHTLRDRWALISFGLLAFSLVAAFSEAIRRLMGNPGEVAGISMTFVAAFGLFGNVLQYWASHTGKDSKTELMLNAHVIGDLGSSAAVVLGGIAIWVWGYPWIDSLLTVLLTPFLLWVGVRALNDDHHHH